MSETMINSVESKATSGVSTMTSSNKVPRNDCNNDQQPKSNMAAHIVALHTTPLRIDC